MRGKVGKRGICIFEKGLRNSPAQSAGVFRSRIPPKGTQITRNIDRERIEADAGEIHLQKQSKNAFGLHDRLLCGRGGKSGIADASDREAGALCGIDDAKGDPAQSGSFGYQYSMFGKYGFLRH